MDIFKQQRKIDFQIICLNFLLLAKLELVKVVYCITSSKVNVSEILEFFLSNESFRECGNYKCN